MKNEGRLQEQDVGTGPRVNRKEKGGLKKGSGWERWREVGRLQIYPGDKPTVLGVVRGKRRDPGF